VGLAYYCWYYIIIRFLYLRYSHALLLYSSFSLSFIIGTGVGSAFLLLSLVKSRLQIVIVFFLACFVVVVVVVRGVVCAEGFILLSHHSKLPLLSVMLCSLNLQI